MALVFVVGILLFLSLMTSLFGTRSDPEALDPEEQRRVLQQRLAEEQRRHEADRVKEQETDRHAVDHLWAKHEGIVSKFLEVTERKVSLLDGYGDESWSVLAKQIQECLCKIGEREHVESRKIRDWTKVAEKYKWHLEHATGQEKQFGEIALRLERTFREYHAAQRRVLPSPDRLRELTGQEFEIYLTRLLPRLGFSDVRGTPTTGDQGADILARRDGRLFVIQAKRQASPVGNKAIQEVAAALRFYGGDEAWVVTNSTFTKAAKELAQMNNVHLVDGPELDAMAADAGEVK